MAFHINNVYQVFRNLFLFPIFYLSAKRRDEGCSVLMAAPTNDENGLELTELSLVSIICVRLMTISLIH